MNCETRLPPVPRFAIRGRVINRAPMIRTTRWIGGNRGDFWISLVKPHPPANRTALCCPMSLASNRMMNLLACFR